MCIYDGKTENVVMMAWRCQQLNIAVQLSRKAAGPLAQNSTSELLTLVFACPRVALVKQASKRILKSWKYSLKKCCFVCLAQFDYDTTKTDNNKCKKDELLRNLHEGC